MNRLGIILAISAIILLPSEMSYQATLMDLIISVHLENNPIEVGEKAIITGMVIDHAGKPVSNAEIKIRFDRVSVTTFTNSTGNFSHDFGNWTGEPGRYILNIMATDENSKIGIADTDFLVRGPVPITAETSHNLGLLDKTKFENMKPETLKDDPLTLTLYNYYQKLKNQLEEEELIQKQIDEKNAYLAEQRRIADEMLKQAILEERPRAGTYSGADYDTFVSNLDPSIREIIVSQLNYTVNAFAEAQFAMEQVLSQGGSIEEARAAYYEKAAVPRELMELLTYSEYEIEQMKKLADEPIIENSTNIEAILNSTVIEEEDFVEPVNVNNNGTTILVNENVSTIFLNINGTIIELIVNGTNISQIMPN